MRYQGKITDWKDDKGFGFVTPNGGGPKVFVHIKSFSNRQRRPVGNELITYELTSDARGRPQGVNIAFVGDRPSSPPTTAPGPGVGALIFAAVFLAFVAGTVATGKLPFVVLIAYLMASCVAYLAYFFDKAAALKGQWRTSESTLHLFSLVGGWPGGGVVFLRVSVVPDEGGEPAAVLGFRCALGAAGSAAVVDFWRLSRPAFRS